MKYKCMLLINGLLLLFNCMNMAMRPADQNALATPCFPHNSSQPHHYFHTPFDPMQTGTQPRNRKKRREQGDYSRGSTTFIEKKQPEIFVEKISEKIDQEIVGNVDCCTKFMVNKIALPARWALSTYSDLLNDLIVVDGHITNLKTEQEFTLLLKKNEYLNNLINRFIERSVDNKGAYPFISGSTVDIFVDNDKPLYPCLSAYLNIYIAQQTKRKYLQENKCKPTNKVPFTLDTEHPLWDKKFITIDGLDIWRPKELVATRNDRTQYPEIHAITIELDLEWGISLKECSFSADGHHMKCRDIQQKELIINLKDGTIVQNANIVWKPSYRWGLLPHENAAVSDVYYVRTYPAGMASDNIFIYRKPTTFSCLCLYALRNSLALEKKYQNNELDALLNSTIVSHLDGFVKRNVEWHIKKAKDKQKS